MVDEPLISTPVPVASVATPAAAPVPTSSGGTASLMTEMDALMATPAPSKEPEKPVEKPAVAAAPRPDSKAVPPKDESGKFVAKADVPKPKDPVELRKRLAEVESDLTKTRAEKESTVGELQRKMADLEKRPFLTKEQQDRYTQLEERSKHLEAQLYARSYADSPEYKEKYQKKWQAKYESSVREVGRLQVKTLDSNGDETTRPASQQDFERVRALRSSEAAQLDEAERIFGSRASLVVKYCNELDGIEQQASEDVAQRRSKYDDDMQQRKIQFGAFSKEMQQSGETTEAELQQKYPTWFGKSEDPEIDSAMKKGLEFVDSTSAEAERLSPQDRGSRAAMIRLWAGAFPRNVHRIQKLEATVEELNRKIAQLQGTDPGAGGEGGASEKKSDGLKGTAGMMADFQV